MKLDYLELVFENTEVMKLEARHIKWLKLTKSNESITINENANISYSKHCDFFSIAIDSNADNEYIPFEIKKLRTTVFKRLEENDISCIYIHSLSDTQDGITKEIEECYFVPWIGDPQLISVGGYNDSVNQCQHYNFDKDGNMQILISENEKLDDIF